MKTKPIHEVRLGGIRAAIWRNDTTTGVRYTVSFSRLYRSGDEWRSTDTFDRDDLLLLAKVADQTHTWVISRPRELESRRPTPHA